MKTSPFWVRVQERATGGQVRGSDLRTAFGAGPWLVLAPHDDDVVIGMGMAVRAATAEGIAVHIAVATDGGLGYVQPHEREKLVETRAKELADSCKVLGVPSEHVYPLGFPDGSLIAHQGCRGPGERDTLAQRLVTLLRALRPSTVFVCTPGDVHPDHRVSCTEMDIACVWASTKIWLERGEPIDLPRRFHYACYAAFEGDPDVEIHASNEALTAKLDALRCFPSQGIVEPLIERLAHEGPYEYLKEARHLAYMPSVYRSMFAQAAGNAASDERDA